jgi:hypothetical protein
MFSSFTFYFKIKGAHWGGRSRRLQPDVRSKFQDSHDYIERPCPRKTKLILLCVFLLLVCVCATCVIGACRGQERALDPLELELDTVVSHQVGANVGAGNQTWVLKSSECS